MNARIPNTQRAVQLTGPGTLVLNEHKPVPAPGPHQILARVEVTGLCFSDLKLLQQFEAHARKSAVLTVLDDAALRSIPSYVPGRAPTVPGHETSVRIVAVGDAVQGVKPGERRLVQTDYRWLKTAESNAAFGYNFEGALQEYVLLDERAITAPDGESTLLPADDTLSASAVALTEPWSCVENAYVTRERRAPRPGGRALRVDCAAFDPAALEAIADESLDDVLFLGADAALLERVFPKLAKGGLLNIVQGGRRFGRPVVTPIGRIHYGGVRITGTPGADPDAGYRAIPAGGELRPGDTVNLIGAAGPMGTMHVIRNLCQGVPGITVFGGDTNEERLAQLNRLAQPVAREHGLHFETYDARTHPPAGPFRYIALMVPSAALAAAAVAQAADGAIINIFAGIPVHTCHPVDLDTCLVRQAYFIGTSGSTIDDMKIVLAKVTARRLDTNLSVSAVSGLDGALDGLRAVEQQSLPGKILVYPACRGLGLTPLTALGERLPDVARHLHEGTWTAAAEQALLSHFQAAE